MGKWTVSIETRRRVTQKPSKSNSSVAEKATQRADALGDVEASSLARVVAEQHGVTFEELFHHSRSRAPIATTRQIAMYLLHVLLGRTLTEVGEFFGRDRTTVSHACARIEDMRDDDKFESEMTDLEDRIWTLLSQKTNAIDVVVPDAVEAANDK